MKIARLRILAAVLGSGGLFAGVANAATDSFNLNNAVMGAGSYDVAASLKTHPVLSSALHNFTDASLNFRLVVNIDPSMYVSTSGPSAYTYWGPIYPHTTDTRVNPVLNAWYPYFAREYDRQINEYFYNPTQTVATASVGSTTTSASNNLLSNPVLFGGWDKSYSIFNYKYHVVADPNGPLGARNTGPVPSWSMDYDVYDELVTIDSQYLNGYSKAFDISVALDATALDTLNTTGTVSYLLSTSGGNVSLDGARLDFNYTSAATTTVPTPPAIWLLGSGLLGLAGISKRRKS